MDVNVHPKKPKASPVPCLIDVCSSVHAAPSRRHLCEVVSVASSRVFENVLLSIRPGLIVGVWVLSLTKFTLTLSLSQSLNLTEADSEVWSGDGWQTVCYENALFLAHKLFLTIYAYIPAAATEDFLRHDDLFARRPTVPSFCSSLMYSSCLTPVRTFLIL